ncbi:MAG: septation protein A [Gammaproteobacteria bacterium]|nr:septation protein A [Gammaproteobacteria bacterium]
MKLLLDFFPIILFFIAAKVYDIYVATAVAIVASVLQVAYLWFRHGRVEKMHLITLAAIVLLGGTTLLLQDDMFIKWKPSVVNWLFALVFVGSQFIGKKPIIQRMMGNNFTLPTIMWTKLNLMWAGFFIFLGLANIYVAYNFDTDTWVNFKLFGMLGLTLLFIIVQTVYISRHAVPVEDTSSDSGKDDDKNKDENQ